MSAVDSDVKRETRPRKVIMQNEAWHQTVSPDSDLDMITNTESSTEEVPENGIMDRVMTVKLIHIRR